MANCSQTLESESRTLRNSLLVYVLNNAATKMPMKQSEMIEILKKENSKKFHEKLSEVKEALTNVYGIILKEVPNSKSGGKKFICFAEDNIQSLEVLHEDQKRETTLLFIILSYIYLSGGSVYEEQLQNFLEGLQIDYVEEHEYFGPNLKKLILETFVKQLYLKREKSDSELDVDVRYLLSWGFRAQMEFKKKQVLEIAARLMGHGPEYFLVQYIEACQEDDQDEDNQNDEDVTIVE